MMTADRFFHGTLIIASVGFLVGLVINNPIVMTSSCCVLGVGLIVVMISDTRNRKKTMKDLNIKLQGEQLVFELKMFLMRKRAEEMGLYMCPVCWWINDNNLEDNYCARCAAVTHEPPAPSER